MKVLNSYVKREKSPFFAVFWYTVSIENSCEEGGFCVKIVQVVLRHKREICTVGVALGIVGVMTGCEKKTQEAPILAQADLVIYAVQEPSVYEPVIKEFEERTNLVVDVCVGTTEELKQMLCKEQTDNQIQESYQEQQKTLDWDLVFGAGVETLEQFSDQWLPCENPQTESIIQEFASPDQTWTSFSALPLVIMYNTNVVTYRELPVGWESLLEPRWKGRVALVDPEVSGIGGFALAAAHITGPDQEDYVKKLAENLDFQTLQSLNQVNEGILDGRYSVGVTSEEVAQALRVDGADVDYIYPEEGTVVVVDGTAIRRGCAHEEAAKQFLEFTISRDAQEILVSDLNRRSVRRDVSPLEGLVPMAKLPIISAGLKELSSEKEEALTEWKQVMEGGGS